MVGLWALECLRGDRASERDRQALRRPQRCRGFLSACTALASGLLPTRESPLSFSILTPLLEALSFRKLSGFRQRRLSLCLPRPILLVLPLLFLTQARWTSCPQSWGCGRLRQRVSQSHPSEQKLVFFKLLSNSWSLRHSFTDLQYLKDLC